MANELRQKGYKITLVFRKEGGARISSINGKYFKGSEGNTEARRILGETLSDAQRKHLEKIKQKKGVFGKKKKNPIAEDITKLQNKINREFKKQGKSARVRRSQIRYRLEHEGEKATKEYLSRALKYAKGYTYNEALETYRIRLEQDKNLVENKDKGHIQEIIDAVDAVLFGEMNLKENDFKELLAITYQFEMYYSSGLTTASDFKNQAIAILSRAV